MEAIPSRIGRYVVENLVGAGGMGQIYKAHDPDIRRTVAIKLISTKLMSRADRAEYIRRFRREAEAAARCAHPNIIAIYDFALHEEEPFLAMEFVYGVSLRQALDAGPVMAAPDAIRVTLQILEALGSAHEQGVIHQDIKPANILLSPDMRVKVADFGIARFVNTEVTSISSSMGTPNYMSPEQCQGHAVDYRSDLFSAGATLFEMVAGEPAFAGHNAAQVSRRIINERVPLLPAAVRDAVPRLQLMLERAMAKQPAERFDSAHEMAEALRQLLKSSEQEITRRSASGGAASGPPEAREEAPSTGWSIDADTLQALEHRLAGYVGPIARVLIRTAAGRSSSLDAVCSQLASSVPDGAERERFRREVEPLIRSRPTAAEGPPSLGLRSDHLPGHELERAQRALSQYVGPVARVLVRRAAAEASSVDALWRALSSHIDSPSERTAFLRRREE